MVCEKGIAKHQHGYTLAGHPVHKKCLIEYTAWEVGQGHPGISDSESRILQLRMNLEHLYEGIVNGQM